MRRALAWAVLVALTWWGGAALAAAGLPEAMSLGAPKAKVVVEEYASLSCPHCARFNAEVFPAFKRKYVDAGKVRYVLHELLTPPQEPAAVGWLTARCAGPRRYFAVVDAVFASQARWEEGKTQAVLEEVAKANGLSPEQFKACVNDKQALAALNARVDKALAEGIRSTPTFVVNGVWVKEGEMTLEELDAAIASASR